MNDYLIHYGILGMKWGIRHWQNADGTFNEAGKIRYFGSKKKETKNLNPNSNVASSRTGSFDKKAHAKKASRQLNELATNISNQNAYAKKKYGKSVDDIYNEALETGNFLKLQDIEKNAPASTLTKAQRKSEMKKVATAFVNDWISNNGSLSYNELVELSGYNLAEDVFNNIDLSKYDENSLYNEGTLKYRK